MKRKAAGVFFLLAAVAVFLCRAVAAQGTALDREGRIADGTRWQTSYRVIDSSQPGPTVLVIAGVHGNEPAGVLAAEQVAGWPISRGRLIVVARANKPGLDAASRYLPDVPDSEKDLNRDFPTAANGGNPVGPLAEALWAFFDQNRPDYVVDLHEGTGFKAAGSESVGSSVIRTDHPQAAALQTMILAQINADIDDPKHRFVGLRNPADGALTEACCDRLGACALIVESTSSKQAMAKRVRQLRLAVHVVLDHLEMTTASTSDLVPVRTPPGVLRVARYNGPGAGYNKLHDHFEKVLDPAPGVILRRIGPEDIGDGVLDQFDVLIMPGGSGSKQAEGLGEKGREAIKRFVRTGGGYVGICAGAYLATANYPWSLAIVDAKSIDSRHWRRGTGAVELEVTEKGQKVLHSAEREVSVKFAQGPLLAPADRDDLPDYDVLAWYRSGVGKNGADPKAMIGTPAIVTGTFGNGRVVVISPHPEQTEGLTQWLLYAVRAAAGK